MTEDDFDTKYNRLYKQVVESGHQVPSPETREKLAILDTNQKYMVQEITEIKEIVKGLDNKLDTVIACKANKSEVDELAKTVKDLEGWKIKIIAIGSVIIFIVSFLKDKILSLINHI